MFEVSPTLSFNTNNDGDGTLSSAEDGTTQVSNVVGKIVRNSG